MNSPLKVPFDTATKAAAYAVCVHEMVPNAKFDIGLAGDSWVVNLEQPIPFTTHQGILNFIEKDSKKNPEKWKDPNAK